MSDPALTHRLRQRSRRAGLMIGFSMLLTIALCAAGFTVIYTALDGFTSDFVSGSDVTPTQPGEVAAQSDGQPMPAATTAPASNGTQNQDNADDQAEPTAAPTEPANEDETPAPTATEEDDAFNPDFQSGRVSINLREGPSTSNSVVEVLPPATPLEYLDEDAPTDGPEDGNRWMKFSTEDGAEGWIREIDSEPYQP